MKQKILIVVVFICVILLATWGWWRLNYSPLTENKPYLGEITFGWNAWPGVLPYLVALDKGFYQDEGLGASMKYEEDYMTLINDLESGIIDFSGAITLMDLLERAESKGLVTVVMTDYSNGADGIVASKEITSVLGLKNKKVAFEEGTFSEYLLQTALKKNGLSLADVTKVNATASEAATAFVEKRVDAAVTYDPEFTNAVKNGDGNRIFTSADVPGFIADVLAFKKDFVEKNSPQVEAVLRAYFRAVEYIKNNKKESYDIGAKYFKISVQDFAEQIQGVKQVDYKDNLTAFSHFPGQESIYTSGRLLNSFLIEQKKLKDYMNLDEVLLSEFLRRVNKR